jgi:AcrR family transcriptional regulator
MTERADAARNRAAVLRAASQLFDDSAEPGDVSMDDIARAAGVGKGTLFRRFGDRSALLSAVYDERLAGLRKTIATGRPPLGPKTPPAERIIAILDAIAAFKLDNRRLVLAIERLGGGGPASLYDAPQYTEMHGLFAELLSELGWPQDVSWTAHALLAATRIDLIDYLVTHGGRSGRSLRADLRAYAGRLLEQHR